MIDFNINDDDFDVYKQDEVDEINKLIKSKIKPDVNYKEKQKKLQDINLLIKIKKAILGKLEEDAEEILLNAEAYDKNIFLKPIDKTGATALHYALAPDKYGKTEEEVAHLKQVYIYRIVCSYHFETAKNTFDYNGLSAYDAASPESRKEFKNWVGVIK